MGEGVLRARSGTQLGARRAGASATGQPAAEAERGRGVATGAEFRRVAGELYCENVPVERIVEAVGTPVYVYSTASIRSRYARLDDALAAVPHRIPYTLKG